MIKTYDFSETKSLFRNPSATVHFYRDEFVIATTDNELQQDYIVLDKNPWQEDLSYYLVYFDDRVDEESYLELIDKRADVLYYGSHYFIVRTDETKYGQLPPAKNDGMVRIFNKEAVLPLEFPVTLPDPFEPNPFIYELFEEICGEKITGRVQHLEDYGTRDAYEPESVLAQQWIEEQFREWGFEDLEVMDFPMPGGPASDNVIARLPGKKYPDEYVVIGGHYDSISWWGDAPGADDNASGTSGVMEIARILIQYEFERSIVFCAFSGEEYGLYGSEAYASRCAQEGKNILGYINMDMIGYLEPGHTTIMTSLIYPESAKPLADFYTDVCSVYLPGFVVEPATFTGGDSDHTSFNNNGYMGIFPFEDVDNYSPYIHTPQDLVGLSYNHEEQAVIFTKAVLTSVVTMADIILPPQNIVADPGIEKIDLQWDDMTDIEYYKVYKDGSFFTNSQSNTFTDSDVEYGTGYEYYVTAVFAGTGHESMPSDTVYATPWAPVAFPLFIDFESGAPYWYLDEEWGLTTADYYSPEHSLTESPGANYGKNENSYAALHPLDLTGYASGELSFWTRYDIDHNSDFMYLQISADGVNWADLDVFTGTQDTWTKKSYPITEYVGNSDVTIRFNFISDDAVTKEGMYIDDFKITVKEPYDYQYIDIAAGWSGISGNIVPAKTEFEKVMQGIAGELIIVQNMTDVYYPAYDINTLGYWESHSGYKIKTDEDVTLVLEGYYEENLALELAAGWNLMPVLSKCPVKCDELFTNAAEELVIVKEVAGDLVYWPSEDIYSLEELMPGKAYLVKTDAPFSVMFPDCDVPAKMAKQVKNHNTPWEVISPTGISHVISVPHTVLENFEAGDFIGVFTPDDLCAAYIKIDDPAENRALVAFANDSLTHETDGFMQNEKLHFKLFETSVNEETDLVAGFDDSFPDTDVFSGEGLSRLASLTIGDDTTSAAIEQMVFSQIYPNPATNRLNIFIENRQQATLRVSNISGQMILSTVIEGEKVIDVSSFPKGVYFFQLKGSRFSEVHRIIIR